MPINFYQHTRRLVLQSVTLQNDKLFHPEKILMVFIISMTRKPSYFKVVHVMFLFFISLFSIRTNHTSDYARSLEWRLRETRLVTYDDCESKYYSFMGRNAMFFGT